jgi:hypothetical protein
LVSVVVALGASVRHKEWIIRMFDPPSIKDLKSQAKTIGELFGSAHRGHISISDRNEVLRDPGLKERMKGAYQAAVVDVGERKALKVALREADIWAEAQARLGPGPYGQVRKDAQAAVRQMLFPDQEP